MNVILAAGQSTGVINALNDAPWYTQLGVAALLGLGAYAARRLNDSLEEGSTMLEIAIFILAVGGVFLAFQGVIGNA